MITSLPHSRCHSPVSPPLSALFGALFTAGLAYGVMLYVDRSPTREAHVPGTEAWWQHAVLAVIVVVAAIGIGGRRRRAGRRDALLLAPIGSRAERRIRRTVRSGRRWRIAAALPPTAVLLYSVFRVGAQVVGGLDPNFTANAWGGPGYVGALLAHCLDAFVLMALSAWLLDRVLEADGET